MRILFRKTRAGHRRYAVPGYIKLKNSMPDPFSFFANENGKKKFDTIQPSNMKIRKEIQT